MVRRTLAILAVVAIALGALAAAGSAATHRSQSHKAAAAAGVRPNAIGQLDCNGYSGIQKRAQSTASCTDLRRVYDGTPGRFYDNGHYIGHDEPSLRFL